MVIFFNRNNYENGVDFRCVLPLEKVFRIVQYGKSIDIFFDSGEYITLEEGGVAVSKVDCFTIKYDNVEIADDVMRSFYAACEQNKGAFYFS